MTFDTSIKLGDLLSVAAFLVTSILAYGALRASIALINQKIDAIEDAIKDIVGQFKDVTSQDKRLAVVEDRQSTTSQLLTQLTRDIGDLRRGDGFIRGSRSGIDGEYK